MEETMVFALQSFTYKRKNNKKTTRYLCCYLIVFFRIVCLFDFTFRSYHYSQHRRPLSQPFVSFCE